MLGLAFALHGSMMPRELRVADTHPPDYPTVQALDYMGGQLSQRSLGGLRLNILHSRSVGEELDTVRQVRAGILDMARVNLAVLNDFISETTVPSLPFVFRSAEHLHHVLDGPIGAEIGRAFERHGLVWLAYYDSGARSFYNTRRPLTSPADLRGLRIRVQQSPVAEAMVRALGAVPVPLPYGQVAMGLATGTLDGAENNWPAYHDTRHYQSARYYSLSEHTMTPEVLVISELTWQSLTAAEQDLLRQTAQASVPVMRALWREREQAARQAVVASGGVVNGVDREAFAEAMRPVYDRFAAQPHLRDLLHRIRSTD